MGVHFKENEEKLTMGMIITGGIVIAILVTTLIMYLINSNAQEQVIEGEKIGEVQEATPNSESVSIDIGKTVNEAANELNMSNTDDETTNETTLNAVSKNETKNETKNEKQNNVSQKTTNESNNTAATSANIVENTSNTVEQNESKEETTEEVKFTAPIKGKILREFASDSLVYSETLKEWITHKGVDIQADKTTVVKAAAKGKVTAIKTDPRYGLTVIVTHENGYQTVYANLLTAEYVVQGEEIEEVHTIGTVGNTATFEIADEYHLHFELIKDGEYINPTNCMEF